MADIAFLATIVAFFLLCVGYVWMCGRIVGDAEITPVELDDEPAVDVRLERAA